jgi:hypothetical protein
MAASDANSAWVGIFTSFKRCVLSTIDIEENNYLVEFFSAFPDWFIC